MRVNRIVETPNNPLDGFHNFLSVWWDKYGLEALLAPVESPENNASARVITDPAELVMVNPFAPLMKINSARFAMDFIREHQGAQLGIIMRPCELRAFIELGKRYRTSTCVALSIGGAPYAQDQAVVSPFVNRPPVAVISLDCLGTYTMDEYQRRVAAHDSVSVTAELLQHIADGGLRAFHFRTACQMCDWPAPNGADITIGLLGIPNGEYFLVIARDEETDTRLKLSSVAPKLATESQVSHRETVVEAVADTRAGVRRKLMEEMQSTCRFGDLSYILAWLANCSLCGECLKACPLFESPNDHSPGSTSSEGRSVLTELVKLSRWLAVCVGCGMCAEACPGHVPLTLLISGLGHRIREEIHYCAGDPAQRLPWLDR